MASAAAKRKKRRDIRHLINQILNDAIRSRRGFDSDLLASYQEVAEQAREQRMAIRELTPRRDLGQVVARRRQREEIELPEHTTRDGIMVALNLVEDLEMVSSGLDIRDADEVARRARRWTEWA